MASSAADSAAVNSQEGEEMQPGEDLGVGSHPQC